MMAGLSLMMAEEYSVIIGAIQREKTNIVAAIALTQIRATTISFCYNKTTHMPCVYSAINCLKMDCGNAVSRGGFCYTEIMDTFGGKEILYPGEMNISDDEMKLIELLLNEHFNKVAKLIFKIEHIRGELGEEEKAGEDIPSQSQQ